MDKFKDFLTNHYISTSNGIEAFEYDDDTIEDITNMKDIKYFFKNIIIFTNNRNDKENKTLKNIKEAIKGSDIQIYPFVADEISYKTTDKSIEFFDSENKFKIDKQSNIDTIVITRLGAQDSNECIALIYELQDWGLFVINPIQNAQKASNKYESSVLMAKYDIPQPKFTLLTKNDIKDQDKSLEKKLKLIYSDVGKNKEEDKKLEYVIKILDGHGGTGVFMTNGSMILAMLQTIFAIDPERELLLQKKEEADGGDIRVHVLTMRTTQTILASMKRVKIKDDFRSNVSLGASAEKVTLTEDQKNIALKVAKVSGMPWCAVDIMPLKKGSNKEIGDNVVLEYNASPGTDGISEVIGENFMKIFLVAINNINELSLVPKSIGYIENITLYTSDDEDDKGIVAEAKLDTGNGAKASTIGCENVKIEGEKAIATINGKEYKFIISGESSPTVGQVKENRVTVKIPIIKLGTRKLVDVEFALVDNRKKSTPILLNRDLLSKLSYIVNPAKKHMLEDIIE